MKFSEKQKASTHIYCIKTNLNLVFYFILCFYFNFIKIYF